MPKIIHIPKKYGVLPLIPIFAGLSAIGDRLTVGVTSVIKTAGAVMIAGARKRVNAHPNKKSNIYISSRVKEVRINYRRVMSCIYHHSKRQGEGAVKRRKK